MPLRLNIGVDDAIIAVAALVFFFGFMVGRAVELWRVIKTDERRRS